MRKRPHHHPAPLHSSPFLGGFNELLHIMPQKLKPCWPTARITSLRQTCTQGRRKPVSENILLQTLRHVREDVGRKDRGSRRAPRRSTLRVSMQAATVEALAVKTEQGVGVGLGVGAGGGGGLRKWCSLLGTQGFVTHHRSAPWSTSISASRSVPESILFAREQ